jgi:hypothetical protein
MYVQVDVEIMEIGDNSCVYIYLYLREVSTVGLELSSFLSITARRSYL